MPTANTLPPRPDASGYCDCDSCRALMCWADKAEDRIQELENELAELKGEQEDDATP